MSSLRDALGIPSTRIPVNASALTLYVLPPILFGFFAAVLVLLPHSRPVRVALWPIVALLALRAVASVDMSLGRPEGKTVQALFVVSMFGIIARTLDWALEKEPLVRHIRPSNSSPSIITDSLDLATNLRGYGWNWSNKLYIPPETRPKDRIAFIFYTLLSAVVHAFVWCLCYQAILSFAIITGHTINELIVFDDTLPFVPRYFRVGVMTAFIGVMAYAALQFNYDVGTVVGIVLLQQDPARWPPLFDAPWCATSLADFWGRRWHQLARRLFLFLGGYPLSIFLGRTGIVLGAFLASAVMHDMYLLGIDSKSEAWRMFAAFGMMAPGMLVEQTFYRLSGKRVSGMIGWVWTMVWLLYWNSFMLDGMAKAMFVGHSVPFHSVVPFQPLLERVVTGFDAWLHTL